MTEPRRIVDDPSVDSELRAAVDRAAREPLPPFDVTSGLARFREAAAALPAAPLPPATAAPALPRLGWLAAGGAAIGLVAWLVASNGARSSAGHVSGPPRDLVPATPVAPIASAPPAPSAADSRVESQPRAPSAASAGPASSTHALPPPAPTIDRAALLAEEVRHLAEVRGLAASDPAAAARAADEGHARFRGGQLYQEREALAITALARAGRRALARQRAERFLQAFPRSPLAGSVRQASGAER